jgi:hypothetical protein
LFDHGPGDGTPLLLASGELAGTPGVVRLHLDHAQGGKDLLLDDLGLGPAHAQPEGHVVEHGHVGERA